LCLEAVDHVIGFPFRLIMGVGDVTLELQVVLVEVVRDNSLGIRNQVVRLVPVGIYARIPESHLRCLRDDAVSGLGIETVGAKKLAARRTFGLARQIFSLG
jgi:hypothetical protein